MKIDWFRNSDRRGLRSYLDEGARLVIDPSVPLESNGQPALCWSSRDTVRVHPDRWDDYAEVMFALGLTVERPG